MYLNCTTPCFQVVSFRLSISRKGLRLRYVLLTRVVTDLPVPRSTLILMNDATTTKGAQLGKCSISGNIIQRNCAMPS